MRSKHSNRRPLASNQIQPAAPQHTPLLDVWQGQMRVKETITKAFEGRLPRVMGLLPMNKGCGVIPLTEFSFLSVVPVNTRCDVCCIRGRYNAAENFLQFADIVQQHDLWERPGNQGRRDQLRTDRRQREWLQAALSVHERLLRRAIGETSTLPVVPVLPRFLLGFAQESDIPFVDTPLLRGAAASANDTTVEAIDAMEPYEARDALLREMFQRYVTPASQEGNNTGLTLIDHALLGGSDLSAQSPRVFVDCRDIVGEVLPHPLVVRGEVLLFEDLLPRRLSRRPQGLASVADVRAWATASDEELAAAAEGADGTAVARRDLAQAVLVDIVEDAQARLQPYGEVAADYIRKELLAGRAWVGHPRLRTPTVLAERTMAASDGLYPKYYFDKSDWAFSDNPAEGIRASRLPAIQVIYRNTRGLYEDSLTFNAQVMGHPQTAVRLGRHLELARRGKRHAANPCSERASAGEPLQ